MRSTTSVSHTRTEASTVRQTEVAVQLPLPGRLYESFLLHGEEFPKQDRRELENLEDSQERPDCYDLVGIGGDKKAHCGRERPASG
jgi:hypothetical protein